MIYPESIAVDDMDNIYVNSSNKLQKFTSSGELMICVVMESKPLGVGLTLYNNQVYVCDTCYNQIHVFDLDLNFIQSIGSHGKGRGEFDAPYNVNFDRDGYMYVAEFGNQRVQVLDRSGHFIRVFGEGESSILALHIIDKYVYVWLKCRNIAVYRTSGQFVTSFGEFALNPFSCITSCADGFIYIYICYYWGGLIQIF